METNGDYFNIQEQQLRDNNNLFNGNRLSPFLNTATINLLENFEKFRKELKFTYIVDWQLTENL
jgi:hypothetical protein